MFVGDMCVCVCTCVHSVCVYARVYIPLNPLNTRCFCQYTQQVCILYNPVCIFRESGIHFSDAGDDEVFATPLASDCAAEIACPAAWTHRGRTNNTSIYTGHRRVYMHLGKAENAGSLNV